MYRLEAIRKGRQRLIILPPLMNARDCWQSLEARFLRKERSLFPSPSFLLPFPLPVWWVGSCLKVFWKHAVLGLEPESPYVNQVPSLLSYLSGPAKSSYMPYKINSVSKDRKKKQQNCFSKSSQNETPNHRLEEIFC